MASDLITLVIRTTCDADADDANVLVGTPTGINDDGAASAAATWVKRPDKDSFLSSLVLDDACDGGNLGSSAQLPWTDGDRRARSSSALRRLETAPVACDVAVRAATPSSGSFEIVSDEDLHPTGEGAAGWEDYEDAAASTAHLASVSLGPCGTTNVMTLTVPHGKYIDGGLNGGHLEENYTIHVRRCWVHVAETADPTDRPTMHLVLPVASVHTAWEPPSDPASSLLARVVVHLDAAAISTDSFVVSKGRPMQGASARDVDGGLSTTPSGASFLSTCAQDAEAALMPPGAPKVRPSLPGRTSARRGTGDSGPTLRPRRPEVGGWGPPPGTRGGHDASFSGPSLPSGRAGKETEETLQAWLERERHETHQLLMIHFLLWTAMVVYLVWDCWRRKARKDRWIQQFLHEQQQQQQQRHSARDCAPVGAGGAAVQGASHGGHPAHDRGWGDDPGAMTPNAATQSDEPTSSHGADHVPTAAVPITTAPRPAQVSHDAFDDALPTEGPGSLSPVSELKARHRLRIQAKRDLKAARLASPSAPHLTPVPHRLGAAALEVTPVRTKESSGDGLESADVVGALERSSPARLTPLPSWTPTRSESNDSTSIPFRSVAATSETAQGAGAPSRRDEPSGDVEPEDLGFRTTHHCRRGDEFSGTEGEGLPANLGGSTAEDSSENQCPEGSVARPTAESATPVPKRAVRPLRPIRPNDPSPRNRGSSVLDAFWNLGE